MKLEPCRLAKIAARTRSLGARRSIERLPDRRCYRDSPPLANCATKRDNAALGPHGNKRSSTRDAARAGEDGKMDLHVFLYDGIVRDWVEIKFQAPTPSIT